MLSLTDEFTGELVLAHHVGHSELACLRRQPDTLGDGVRDGASHPPHHTQPCGHGHWVDHRRNALPHLPGKPVCTVADTIDVAQIADAQGIHLLALLQRRDLSVKLGLALCVTRNLCIKRLGAQWVQLGADAPRLPATAQGTHVRRTRLIDNPAYVRVRYADPEFITKSCHVWLLLSVLGCAAPATGLGRVADDFEFALGQVSPERGVHPVMSDIPAVGLRAGGELPAHIPLLL